MRELPRIPTEAAQSSHVIDATIKMIFTNFTLTGPTSAHVEISEGDK